MTSAVGFYFNTFKDCLMFLQWLYVGAGSSKLFDVVKGLHDLLQPCYKDVDISQIQSDLSKFLSKVDKFYEKLAVKKSEYVNLTNSNPKSEDLVDALLVCIPKFFSVIYYLWYDVNPNFDRLGGGRWMYDYPGYDGKNLLGHYWGGALQKYLTGTTNSTNYNNSDVIPGGFLEGEIKYGYNNKSGFYQGRSMITELSNLVDKESTKWNLFRDVFSTTVFPTNAGAYRPNIANVLSLMDTFCDVVKTERSVIALERHDGLGKTFIHWTGLLDQCEHLRHQLGKIFKIGDFSFTGYSRDSKMVKAGGFTQRTAAWLRGHLSSLIQSLEEIQLYTGNKYYNVFATDEKHFLIKDYRAALWAYFTRNFFPYGFTFYGDSIYTLPKDPHKTLLDDWNTAIIWLRGGNGLAKFKRLLEGLDYPQGYMHEGTTHGTQLNDKSKENEVLTTKDPNDLTSNTGGAPNQDNNGGSGHLSGTKGDRDELDSQQGHQKGPQETPNPPTSSGGDAGEAGFSEGGNVNDHKEDGNHVDCKHKVPQMEDSEHDECFLHRRETRPWSASQQ